jgi:hypothetical protein
MQGGRSIFHRVAGEAIFLPYHQVIKIVARGRFPRNVGAGQQDFDQLGAILPLARFASCVTISSS